MRLSSVDVFKFGALAFLIYFIAMFFVAVFVPYPGFPIAYFVTFTVMIVSASISYKIFSFLK